MIEVKQVLIKDIDANPDNQARCEPCEEAIADYARMWADDAALPPIDVFFDGNEYILADGFHRHDGAIRAGLETILCRVHEGDERAARLFGLAANQQHGLRRTNADKRNAVALMLADDEWRDWSDRRIAEHLGVSHDFANRVRKELSSNDSSEVSSDDSRVGKDGKRRQLPRSAGQRRRLPQPAKQEPECDPDDAQNGAAPQGAETVRPAQREEAVKLISRLVKVLDAMGIYDQYFKQLDQILAGVREA